MMRLFGLIAVLFIAPLIAIACSTEATAPAPQSTIAPANPVASPTRRPPQVSANTSPTSAAIVAPTATPQPAAPTAATLAVVDPELAPYVGTYQFRPEQHDETGTYLLVLNADGSASIDEQLFDTEERNIESRGTWRVVGNEVIMQANEVQGEAINQTMLARILFEDGFPIITDVILDDEFIHLDDTGFNIGAGERSPLVIELNRRLAAVPWLGYTNPGSDLYTEEVRKAVVAFQESQGLWPDGVLNEETWLALDQPAAPLPTPTPIPVETPVPVRGQPIVTIPDLSQLPKNTEDGRPILYLTFDDGPLPDYTPALLEVLSRHGVEATFFMLGRNVATWPEIVREAAVRGHYIANHTWDHSSMEGMTLDQFVNQIDRTSRAIVNAAGEVFSLDLNVRYVRPPYGATDYNTRQFAANKGMAVVLWDIDTQDWRQPGVDIIANHMISSAFPGAIILMHDGGGERTQTIDALDIALPQLQAQGYVFRTVFLP